MSNSKRQLPGLIMLLSMLWCVLLTITVWVYLVTSGTAPAPSPPPSVAAALASSGASTGSASGVVLVWDSNSVSKLLEGVQWWAIGLGLLLALALGIAAAVQEKMRAAGE